LNKLLLRKKAELSILHSVPTLSDAVENSRLAGLQRRLQKIVHPIIQGIKGVSAEDMAEVIQKIHDWGIVTGWLQSKRHTSTVVSFCLRMIEESPVKHDPKILEILTALAAHLENSKEMRMLSCKAGDIAYEKWKKLFREGSAT